MDTIKKTGKKFVNWIARSKVKVIVITTITVFCLATIFATASNVATININIDGYDAKITTLKKDAYEIIKQANIEIDEDDIVILDEFDGESGSVISIYKSHTISVSDNGGKFTDITGNGSVATALLQNGIKLNDGDEINFSKGERIYEGMKIVISRAFPVTINAGGEIYKVNMAGGTISDALDKAVLTIDDDDIISKPLSTPLKKGMSVKITRVTFTDREVKTDIPFKTETKRSASMSVDQSKIERKGVKGQKVVTYRDKYVDGKLVESKAGKSVVSKKPVNQIKVVGTRSTSLTAGGIRLAKNVRTISNLTPPSSLKLNGLIPTSYKRKLVGTASAYSGGGVTATGRAVMNGYVAVNPNQIPYHSKMWIVSNDGKYIYGYASAEDTGGFIHWTGNRSTICDLYFSSPTAASNFGRRSVTIYIV